MSLSVRNKPYFIPEYSLTGDLLSYLNCGLQYRYYNKGSLPPSKPVQLWFGEFIHGVMEDAYLEWRDSAGHKKFPWDWIPNVRDIEVLIWRRLAARRMSPPPRLFCPYDAGHQSEGLCPDTNHPHQLYASQRAFNAINTWGQHLFPLIQEAELKLKGTRPMPNYQSGRKRSEYYSVTGIVDVLSSVNLQNAPSGNLILHYLENNEQIKKAIITLNGPEYEIIIDYKGMRRPSVNDPSWKYHEWQLMTYSWLRSQQSGAKPVIAGIIFYLDELAPSKEDLNLIREDVNSGKTDVMPTGMDKTSILNWKSNSKVDDIKLTQLFKERRSIRVVSINSAGINDSLNNFDGAVDKIEDSVFSESSTGNINNAWTTNPIERNCTVCDFKTFCPNPSPKRYNPTVP